MTDLVTLRAGDVAVVLDPSCDGRAISWSVGDLELLGRRSERLVEHGMYAMGPWAGRVRGNVLDFGEATYPLDATHDAWALHGTTLGSAAEVELDRGDVSVDADCASATVTLPLGPHWPWGGRLIAHWTVSANCIALDLVLSSDADVFPGVIGWHPWFNRKLVRGSAARWSLPVPLLAERDPGYVLSGRLLESDLADGPYDDAFLVAGKAASIDWPGALRLDVESSHPWFVVYDGQPGFICVEPQTGPPNGINDALVEPVSLVSPDRPLVLSTRWTITRALRVG